MDCIYRLDVSNNRTILNFGEKIFWKPATKKILEETTSSITVACYMIHHTMDIKTLMSIYQRLT
jgi:hypothetical protein